MVHRIALTRARINLGQLVRRVHVNGEYFVLEKDGIPVAGLMGADEMEDYLELRNPDVREQIGASQQEYLAGKARPARPVARRRRAATPRRKRARR